MLLGQFGLAYELTGQQLLPIGTVYDPFVCRGLDALIYGLYSGAQVLFAGTPAGVSLSPEGGAHQSTVTPSIGIELPGLSSPSRPSPARSTGCCSTACALAATRASRSTCASRRSPIDQPPFAAPLARSASTRCVPRSSPAATGTVTREPTRPGDPIVVACGSIVPEALAAAELLAERGGPRGERGRP